MKGAEEVTNWGGVVRERLMDRRKEKRNKE